jgi:hypothetical protein
VPAEVPARRSSRSLLATPARYSRSARRSGRLGADARSRSAAPPTHTRLGADARSSSAAPRPLARVDSIYGVVE